MAGKEDNVAAFLRARLGVGPEPGMTTDGLTPEGLDEGGFNKEFLMAEAEKDVDDEMVAQSLEDKGLLDHMAHARTRAREAIERAKRVDEAQARTDFTTALGKFSGILGKLRDPLPDMDRSASEVLIIARHIPAAIRGHGIPPNFDDVALPSDVASLSEVLALAAKVEEHLNKNGKKLTSMVDVHRKLLNELSTCHMAIATAFDALTRVIHAKNEQLEAQKQALEMQHTLVDVDELKEAERRREIMATYSSRSASTSKHPPTVGSKLPAAVPEESLTTAGEAAGGSTVPGEGTAPAGSAVDAVSKALSTE